MEPVWFSASGPSEQSPIAKLSTGSIVALLLIAEAALLSQITVAILLLYVLFNAIRNHVRPPSARGQQPWRFIRTATDYYFFNLLFMDLIQALGSVLHIRWIHRGEVEARTAYCGAQGFAKQFGDVGVALSTLVIAVHTFVVIFLRWKIPDTKWLPLGVIGLIWLFLVLIISIPWATEQDYYYQTGYWCWINRNYGNLQYGLEYYIMWIVAFAGFALYIPLFFRLRHAVRNYPEHARQQMHIARQLLVYPIAYVIIITPISVVRKVQFTNAKTGKPPVATALIGFAGVVFGLSGFVNTVLYIITRPSIFRSFLSSFLGGSPADPGAAQAQQDGRRRGAAKPTAMTIPEVTILSESGHECDIASLGFQEGADRRYQQHHGEIDYGLPNVTVMSANHLTPPSLLTRGTVVESNDHRDLERPSCHRLSGTASTAATNYRGSYSLTKEWSSNASSDN